MRRNTACPRGWRSTIAALARMTARWTRLQPLYLVSQGLRDFRAQFLPDYRKLTNAILLQAAQGSGDD